MIPAVGASSDCFKEHDSVPQMVDWFSLWLVGRPGLKQRSQSTTSSGGISGSVSLVGLAILSIGSISGLRVCPLFWDVHQ